MDKQRADTALLFTDQFGGRHAAIDPAKPKVLHLPMGAKVILDEAVITSTPQPQAAVLSIDVIQEAVEKLRNQNTNPWPVPVQPSREELQQKIREQDREGRSQRRQARLDSMRIARAFIREAIQNRMLPRDDSDSDLTAFNDGLRAALDAIDDTVGDDVIVEQVEIAELMASIGDRDYISSGKVLTMAAARQQAKASSLMRMYGAGMSQGMQAARTAAQFAAFPQRAVASIPPGS